MFHKGLTLEVVIPITESVVDIVKLIIISGVVQFGATQLSSKISQGLLGLGKDNPHASSTKITFNFKRSSKLGRPKIGAKRKFSLIVVKAL